MARRLGVVWVFLGWGLVSSTSFGQTQKGTDSRREHSSNARVTDSTEDGWTAVFDDDPLSGEGFGANTPMIRVRRLPAYGFLIRPRTHFVPELLKSVEKI